MARMQKWKQVGRAFVRYVLPAIVIIAVGWHFFNILRKPELREIDYAFRVQWLLPAGLLYLAAHTIWASYWVMLLRQQGFPARYPTGLRAYFISQYGKYIPGKVWVIFIRIAILGASRKDKAIVGMTATYETLTSMGAGALVGALLMSKLQFDQDAAKYAKAVDVALFVVALVPLGLALMHQVIVQIARARRGPDGETIINFNLLLLVQGYIQAAIGYFILGISLWMTMQLVLPQPPALDGESLLKLTAINAIAYIFGFVMFFLPGGVGAREGVLAALLTGELITGGTSPDVAAGLAVVVTLVLRLIWTVAEVILAVLLYRFIPADHRPVLVPAEESVS